MTFPEISEQMIQKKGRGGQQKRDEVGDVASRRKGEKFEGRQPGGGEGGGRRVLEQGFVSFQKPV